MYRSQDVSKLLSEKNDPTEHFQRALELQPIFTWQIIQAPMRFSYLQNLIVGYATTLWTVIVLPALISYAEDLKAGILTKVNQTLSGL